MSGILVFAQEKNIYYNHGPRDLKAQGCLNQFTSAKDLVTDCSDLIRSDRIIEPAVLI